jgi:hypothetical protein
MSDSLTTLISKVQATLGDDGTYFTTATITAAARQALAQMNRVYPVHNGSLVTIVSGQKEYVLSDVDFVALNRVTGVWLNDDDGDLDDPLIYDYYVESNVPNIRLRTSQASGLLLVRFTSPQTINGLDSETSSSLPAWLDPLLVTGISYLSLATRGIARIEAFNLNRNVAKDYATLREMLKLEWESGLASLAATPLPVSEPDTSAWNDRWYQQG